MKLFTTILLALSIIASGYAAERHVGSGQTYSTIQEAVDASSPGDIIIVHEGVYREQVVIDVEGITIQAFEGDSVTVSGTELITSWTDIGNGVYSATVDWDVTEASKSMQVFQDGKMINLVRWPKLQEDDDFVGELERGTMDNVSYIGETGESPLDKEISFTDADFDQNASVWNGCKIWLNLSNPDNEKDGQGTSGIISSLSGTTFHMKGVGLRVGNTNWGITTNSRYYLFDPLPENVSDPSTLLGNGEWWKNGNTLYVKTWDGTAPSSTGTGSNIIEVKKRNFAFSPSKEAVVLKNVIIKNISIFAASITTEYFYNGKPSLSEAENNVFDNIDGRYIDHLVDLTGHYQAQWIGSTGIILSGTNNTLKNSRIHYSAASAISCMGYNNKIFNNRIYQCNYQVTEAGCINFGVPKVFSYNHDVGYNTIYETPHSAIAIKQLANYNLLSWGVARIHHNKMHSCLLRAHDSGVLDGAGDMRWTRIDHNLIYDVTGFLQIGVYLDYGDWKGNSMGRILLDHNIIYNVNRPVQLNHFRGAYLYNNVLFDGIGFFSHAGISDNGSFTANNISGGGFGTKITNHTAWNKFNECVDPEAPAWDFHLKSDATKTIDQATSVAPYNTQYLTGNAYDIGAYEYNTPDDPVGYSSDLMKVADPVCSVKGGRYDSITVNLSCDTPGAEIRYTTDGTTPTVSYGKIFFESIKVSSSCKIMAMAHKEGYAESYLVEESYDITGPRMADTLSKKANGLEFEAQTIYFPELMNFGFLPVSPEYSGTTNNFNLSVVSLTNDFAMQFSGYILIDSAGEYTFYTQSDDGCQLWIGDNLLIDNTGTNEELSKDELSAIINLSKGLHAISLNYYEKEFTDNDVEQDADNAQLSVKYKGPGLSKRNIPDVRLFRSNPENTDFNPEVSFINPVEGTYLEAGKTIGINAEAWDKGGIDSVVFYVDDVKLSSVQSEPFTLNYAFAPGSHTLKATAWDISNNSHFDEINLISENYNVAEMTHVQDTISIDGRMEEPAWASASEYKIDRHSIGDVTDYTDLDASFRAIYSASGIYFGINVRDNDVQQSGFETGELIIENDAIELFFDSDNSKSDYYDNNDFHFAFDINGESIEFSKGNTEGIDFVTKNTLDGYLYEGYIPWELLKCDPLDGDKTGLEIKICDNDNGEYEGKLSFQESGTDLASNHPNRFGVAAFSDNIIDITPPAAPVLQAPENNLTTNATSPMFNWGKVDDPSGILHYEFEIDGESFEVAGNENIFKYPAVLINGSYSWKVRAIDKDENTGAWSETRTLVVDDAYMDNTGPAAPVLTTPLNGVNLTSSEAEFDWEDVFDINGINGYEIQINSKITDAGYKSHYSASGLTALDSVWKVRAIDGNGNAGAWSEAWEFNLTGVTNDAIGRPAYASSTEAGKTSIPGGNDGDMDTRWGSAWTVPSWYYIDLGEEKIINRVRIFWQGAHATVYQLQVSNDATNWTTFLTESGNPDGLVEVVNDYKNLQNIEGRYVRMYATAKSSQYGVSFMEFEIYTGIPPVDTNAPPVPEGILPTDGAILKDLNPLLKWTEVKDTISGIDHYVVDVNGTEYDAGHKTYLPLSYLSEGSYSWKVKAVDGSENESAWSDLYSFSIDFDDSTPPSGPSLLFPPDDSIIDMDPIPFQWTTADDESELLRYEIEVNGSVTEANRDTMFSMPLDSGTHSWRVRAIDVAGNTGAWSEMFEFEYRKIPVYIIKLFIIPGGSATAVIEPEGRLHKQGTEVTINLTFADGYNFVEWSGAASGNSTTINFEMTSDKTIYARVSNNTSIEEFSDGTGILVYPNPYTGKEMNIVFTKDQTDPVLVSIVDMQGKALYSKQKSCINNRLIISDLPSIKQGVYMIRLRTNNEVINTKLLVR